MFECGKDFIVEAAIEMGYVVNIPRLGIYPFPHSNNALHRSPRGSLHPEVIAVELLQGDFPLEVIRDIVNIVG